MKVTPILCIISASVLSACSGDHNFLRENDRKNTYDFQRWANLASLMIPEEIGLSDTKPDRVVQGNQTGKTNATMTGGAILYSSNAPDSLVVGNATVKVDFGSGDFDATVRDFGEYENDLTGIASGFGAPVAKSELGLTGGGSLQLSGNVSGSGFVSGYDVSGSIDGDGRALDQIQVTSGSFGGSVMTDTETQNIMATVRINMEGNVILDGQSVRLTGQGTIIASE